MPSKRRYRPTPVVARLWRAAAGVACLAIAIRVADAQSLGPSEALPAPASGVTLGDAVEAEPMAGPLIGPSIAQPDEASRTAYPNGSFAEELATAGASTSRGVGGSPHRTGPGLTDDWWVGPRWRMDVDGVVLYRRGADLPAIIAAAPLVVGAPIAGAPELLDNFDHAAGARLLLTSEYPQSEGYELQVGYLGVERWTAGAYFPISTVPADPPASDVEIDQRRSISYTSALHSVEINFQRVTSGPIRPFGGFRYISLRDRIRDSNDQFNPSFLPDPVGVGSFLVALETDTINEARINNNLVGFQSGLRMDTWRPTRGFRVDGFLSGGLYCDIVGRKTVFERSQTRTQRQVIDTDATAAVVEGFQNTVTTSAVRSDVSANGANLAFTTEASLAGVWQVTPSLALRGGYQVQFLTGIELAQDLWVGGAPTSRDLFLHGWFAGLQYRR